jgi:lipoprotein-anchoring transpeptidase ErfK/SrfK
MHYNIKLSSKPILRSLLLIPTFLIAIPTLSVITDARAPRLPVPAPAERFFAFSPLPRSVYSNGNSVVVNLQDKRMTVYAPSGDVLREYAVFIGTKSRPTPRGHFRIMENVKPSDDEWYLGPRWIGFAIGYDAARYTYAGFHGWVYTKADDAAEKSEPGWKTTTQGCVQLRNEDLKDFATLVDAGDEVTIVDQPLPAPHKAMVPTLVPAG